MVSNIVYYRDAIIFSRQECYRQEFQHSSVSIFNGGHSRHAYMAILGCGAGDGGRGGGLTSEHTLKFVEYVRWFFIFSLGDPYVEQYTLELYCYDNDSV